MTVENAVSLAEKKAEKARQIKMPKIKNPSEMLNCAANKQLGDSGSRREKTKIASLRNDRVGDANSFWKGTVLDA